MDPRDPSMNIPPHQSQSHAHFPMAQSSQSLPPSVQCSPIFVEYQLMKEFVLFQKQNFPHIYLVPSHSSAFDWFGVMFIHNGLYNGKMLRFSLYISASYPNCDVPKISFDPIPIHPFVNQTTGELNTSFRFTKWNSTNNFIYEIVQYSKSIFEINDLNDLKQCTSNQIPDCDYDTNGLKTLISKNMSNFNDEVIKKNGDDKHSINFTEPENESVISKLRNKLITGKVSNENNQFDQFGKSNSYNGAMQFSSPSISGLSWSKNIVFK